MQQVKSVITEFRGSHYDFGLAQAEWLKSTLMMENREREWRLRRPRFDIDPVETEKVYQQFAPKIWEELMGIQDGLQLSLEQVLLNFGHYRVYAKESGCSVFTSDSYLVRNYDYHPATYDGRLTFFQPNDGGLATMAPVSRITGRMDGINELGLTMGYNFMHRKKPGDGFVCYMVGRLILETCANVQDVVDLLHELPHRSSFSYIVLDPSGTTKIIEITPRDVVVRDHHYCTNHFEVLTHENRRVLTDSKMRMQAMTEQVTDALTADQAFRIMNNTEAGIFSDKYASWSGTIHTSCYFPKELKALFALGGNQSPVELDFGKWLAGHALDIQTIHGQIDSTITFASE
ncbi:C45 family autoproteolytic acyltransferase/hydolase [Macrococcus bovicus]|uniref:C45 family autoproteolytic acyltransferase/hydolase n=1 Tax=Macrococcus bovicus TaxID=69968 RepID=UPI0025A5E123|nr:C45 family autoproteolytic acyltransferase/hydolase [Macrococcus bovicus]WJP97503.1 C45 family autoproteolytic acyltransferase/hydrolase [Macrococcus bovicus]